MDMELTYIYHSGFALSGDGFTVIMDYYRDSEDGQAHFKFSLVIYEKESTFVSISINLHS